MNYPRAGMAVEDIAIILAQMVAAGFSPIQASSEIFPRLRARVNGGARRLPRPPAAR